MTGSEMLHFVQHNIISAFIILSVGYLRMSTARRLLDRKRFFFSMVFQDVRCPPRTHVDQDIQLIIFVYETSHRQPQLL